MSHQSTISSTLPDFEELLELERIQHANAQDCLQAFLSYVNHHEKCNDEWLRKENDLIEQLKLVKKDGEKHVKSLIKEKECLESSLKNARKLIDQEKSMRKRAEDDRNSMEYQLQEIRNLLHDNRNKLHDETREKLQYLSTIDQRLSTINESLHDTMGSDMSDLSYSRSEDGILDADYLTSRYSKKLRRSMGVADASVDQPVISAKRRRSALNTARSDVVRAGPGECIVATTRVDMRDGQPPTASSIIETFPSSTSSIVPPLQPRLPSAPQMSTDSGESDPDELLNNKIREMAKTPSKSGLESPASNGFFPFGMNMINTRTHTLVTKTVLRPEVCDLCVTKIKFGKTALRCTECRTLLHSECKDKLKLPCIPPGSGTPTAKDSFGTIADYAPRISPMIPAIIYHCVTEIERRGMGETGLYRVSGSDREVKSLKDKFLKGKGQPNLALINDINVLTSCLKDFLRSLQEPLVTYTHRPRFIESLQNTDVEARRAALYQCFTELPQPNRDTLAFLILHLQRVGDTPECRMPISSLAKVLGPTIVGFSRPDTEMIKVHMFEESQQSVQVTEELLSIPAEYWNNFLARSMPGMPCTPSTGSLRDHCGFFDSPVSSGWYTVRKKKN